MKLTLIIIFSLFLVAIVLYKIHIYNTSNKPNKSGNVSQLIKEIFNTIEYRKEEIYYQHLHTYITNLINNSNTTNYQRLLHNIDSIHCTLKRDLRIFDEFTEFLDRYEDRKKRYKTSLNSSLEVLRLLEKKYTKEVTYQYLTHFNPDSSILEEIEEIDSLINFTKQYYSNFLINDLVSSFTRIKKLDHDLIMTINEPIRLMDKFIASEDNIIQLESELDDKEGSLYYKVSNVMKVNSNLRKSDIEQWDSIKQKVVLFREKSIVDTDIIEINGELCNIIYLLTQLDKSVSNYTRDTESEGILIG